MVTKFEHQGLKPKNININWFIYFPMAEMNDPCNSSCTSCLFSFTVFNVPNKFYKNNPKPQPFLLIQMGLFYPSFVESALLIEYSLYSYAL